MNKQQIILGCAIFIIAAAAIFIYIYLHTDPVTRKSRETLRTIKHEYMNHHHMIHAYPGKVDSQYLSESAGLYMNYLVKTGREDEFEEYVEEFKEQFLIEKNGQVFVKWELDTGAHVNALIDDMRIVAALNRGARLFSNSKYTTLADKIVAGIKSKQLRDETVVDFYDWKYDKPADRITLSYLTGDFFHYFSGNDREKRFLENATVSGNAFFPEYYKISVDSGQYISKREVHMVDQILIAMNRKNLGFDSPRFLSWLKEKWQQEHKIYGRYDRSSGNPSVKYESLSVYDYMQRYLDQAGEHEMAKETRKRMREIAPERDLGETHFFDYIHYRFITTK
ncbi:hypothetical protein QR721_10715 [Aciduricibacillus chroicocephali]|uniref:Glycoside transferase n=1 Tax=Aciduricibacillus chroicocephali TaxID=3054939 RepID=A0ABY9KTH7_9BACI|nr:hypothetical protein QR721_10715 [Bacillaceae bacterium 44XB]